MQARDFLDALAGQHNELQSARLGGMNRRIGAFQPAIELHERFLVEPARALDLGFGRNCRGRIVWDTEAARGCIPIVVVRFHPPTIGRVDVTAARDPP